MQKRRMVSGALVILAFTVLIVLATIAGSLLREADSPAATPTPSPSKGPALNILDAASIVAVAVAAWQAPTGPEATPRQQQAYLAALEAARKDPKSPGALDIGVVGGRLLDFRYSPGGTSGCWVATNTAAAGGAVPARPAWVLYADFTAGFQLLDVNASTCEEAAAAAAQVTTAADRAQANQALLATLSNTQQALPTSALTKDGFAFMQYLLELTSPHSTPPSPAP